jgi:molecular chaperone DnaK (HSP70)
MVRKSGEEDGEAPDAAETPATAEQVETAAKALHMASGMVEKLVNTKFTNVCSRGFGIKILRDDVDPATARDPEDFVVKHIIEPNTPLPLTGMEEGRVQTFYTVVDDQDSVNIEIMEQVSRELSEDMESNKFLEKGLFKMSRSFPRQSPIHIALGMENNGVLQLHATDADGLVMDFNATAAGAVHSDEEIAASTDKVQAMRQGA